MRVLLHPSLQVVPVVRVLVTPVLAFKPLLWMLLLSIALAPRVFYVQETLVSVMGCTHMDR